MDHPTTDEVRPEGWRRRALLAAAGLAGIAALARAGPPAEAAQPLAPIKPTGAPLRVAVLIDQGATLIDFAGPWEIFSSAIAYSPGFDVFSVAPSRAPIRCDNGRQFDAARFGAAESGLKVIPDFTFDDAPQPNILVAGAQSGANDPKKMAWIHRVYPGLDLAMSVCVGAYVLGFAGLLDGGPATTNARRYDNFERTFPKVKVVRGVRFVESGKVATATGLTAGVDLALRVTERVYGRDVATKLAGYEEWKSPDWIVQT